MRRLELGLGQVALAALLLSTPTSADDGVEWQRCRVGSLGARCSSIELLERRDRPEGRTIELPFVLVDPTEVPTEEPTEDPLPGEAVVVLEGGPGASVSQFALLHAQTFAGARRHRALLLVDQRGTGRSGSLDCDLMKGFRRLATPESVAACREALAPDADLAYYTTDDVVLDLVELLDRLGVERVDLFGSSYGTRTALRFAARHPDRIRTMILMAPYPTTHNVLVEAAPVLDDALAALVESCAAEAECFRSYPRLDETIAELPHRLGDRPDWGLFTAGVRMMLFFPLQAARVPQLLDMVARSGRLPPSQPGPQAELLADWVSEGAFLSILCSEDAARTDVAAVREAARGTFMGAGWGESLVASCAEWPRRELPEDFSEPVRSDVPALLLVGENDPAMPPAWAHDAAATLPNARVVEIPHGQHSFIGMRGAGCLVGLIERFLDAGSVEGLDTSCTARMRPPPFAPPAGTGE
ncbi:MAG: alpha/beta fold hydrolase [Thermoanaerobaculia bacterium]|nr:alpha/beta fold hydrolase [Thermoanaerobaculia bacterium]